MPWEAVQTLCCPLGINFHWELCYFSLPLNLCLTKFAQKRRIRKKETFRLPQLYREDNCLLLKKSLPLQLFKPEVLSATSHNFFNALDLKNWLKITRVIL